MLGAICCQVMATSQVGQATPDLRDGFVGLVTDRGLHAWGREMSLSWTCLLWC